MLCKDNKSAEFHIKFFSHHRFASSLRRKRPEEEERSVIENLPQLKNIKTYIIYWQAACLESLKIFV